MSIHHRSDKQRAADFAKRANAIITPVYIYLRDWKLERKLFQLDWMGILPADLEALTACYEWTHDYMESAVTNWQLAAANRYAMTAHEISCIRRFRKAIFSSPTSLAYLRPEDLAKLAALNRCERLAKAAHKRARDYLARAGCDVPEVFCQNKPKSPHHLVHNTTQ